jgi:hypothetical protein
VPSGYLPLDAPRTEAITHEESELSTVIVQQRRPDVPTHPFAGRARWGAAALLVTGALLQVAEFLLENPPDDTAARVDSWAQNLSRVGLSEAVGLLAVPFLIGSFAVMIALARVRSPRLTWTAGAFLACAMTGLAAVHGAEMMAYGLLRAGNHAAAVSALGAGDLGLPGVVLLVLFLGGVALGVPTMSVALWRSPLVPRIAPAFLIAFLVLDLGGWPVLSHVLGLAGGVVLAWAVLTGYSRRARTAGQ